MLELVLRRADVLLRPSELLPVASGAGGEAHTALAGLPRGRHILYGHVLGTRLYAILKEPR
jgi:hypothetical protein